MQNDRCTLEANSRRELARRVAIALAVLAMGWSGCARAQRAGPVDGEAARDALKTVLDGWKKGDAPAALKEGSPSIIVQDLDWMGGAKLVDYRVEGEGKAVEANLFVPVNLTLRNGQGKEVKKRVSYVVGTSPIVTVFRALR